MSRPGKMKALLGAAAIMAGIAVVTLVQHGSQATATDRPAAGAPPAVPVDTVTVESRQVRLWRGFSARLEAVDEVALRPQVSGTIVDVRFRDGAAVAKGDILFVIDPRPYKAAVAQAQADLDGVRERREFAKRELERARKLVKTKAIPERTFDERDNTFATAGSDVEAAEARLAQARINLDHAYVKAPIAGRVSRAEVTVGNLVQAGAGAPLLTTIVSRDAIYADFDVDEATYLNFVRAGGTGGEDDSALPVNLTVGADSTEAAYEGHVHAFDNRIDPKTGTIRARALFRNTDGRLLPGMFATVRMGTPSERPVVLLSERAVMTDQDRKFVYVVNDESRAIYRQVRLGDTVGKQRVIESGLKPGEQVIVGGAMTVRPNAKVAPRPAAADEAAR